MIVGACGGPPPIAVYGPTSATGVTLEDVHKKPPTKMFSAGCTIEGTIRNDTDRDLNVELVGEVIAAERRGLTSEMIREVHPVRTNVMVPGRSRARYSIHVLRIWRCERLMYLEVKSLVVAPRY